jgi:hypothetical protein
MKYICFLTFFSGLVLSGCGSLDPEGIIKLKGKVLDENTKVSLPDREIIVQALVKEDRKYISSHLGIFHTDSTGCFEYNLKKVKSIYIYDFCVVGDSVYAFSDNKIGITLLNKKPKFLTFYVSKLADLTIIIDRKSKTSYCETLYISWESNGINDEILYPYKIENHGFTLNSGLRWVGGDIHATIKTKVFADKKTIVHWKLFGNGKFKEITDTIFCKRDVVTSVCFKY